MTLDNFKTLSLNKNFEADLDKITEDITIIKQKQKILYEKLMTVISSYRRDNEQELRELDMLEDNLNTSFNCLLTNITDDNYDTTLMYVLYRFFFMNGFTFIKISDINKVVGKEYTRDDIVHTVKFKIKEDLLDLDKYKSEFIKWVVHENNFK